MPKRPRTTPILGAVRRFISMAWYCSGSTNTELIENLSKTGLIKNERVKKAMMGVRELHSLNPADHISNAVNLESAEILISRNQVDRAHYAPSRPYSDSPQPIGHGATISAPHMHGHACEHLIEYLKPGSRVLDIGSGSGYLTHVLANLVAGPSSQDGTNGQVVGLEHIPELVDLATSNMRKSDRGREFLDSDVVKFVAADGRLGWQESAPYDAIHVGAAAATLHPVLVEQLRAPGRMFIPVDTENDGGLLGNLGSSGGQFIWVVDKKADGSVHKEKVFPVSYVPLTDRPGT